MGERLVRNEEVDGSIPLCSTKKNSKRAGIRQLQWLYGYRSKMASLTGRLFSYFKIQSYLLKQLYGKNDGKNPANNGKNDGKNLSDAELTDNERRILLELINNPSIPYDTLVANLGISRRTVSRVFSSLEEKGFIERVGTNKKGYWKIIK